MANSPQVAAMGRTLVDQGADLCSDRAVILCLIGSGYDARDIEASMDAAIAFAKRIHDARGTLEIDATLRRVAAVMRAG